MTVTDEPPDIICGTIDTTFKIKKENSGETEYLPLRDSPHGGVGNGAFKSDGLTVLKKTHTDDTSQAGIYEFQWRSGLIFLDATKTHFPYSTIEADVFRWTVIDPCMSPTLSSVQGPSYFGGTVVSYQLGSGILPVLHHSSQNFTAYPTFCGDVTVTVDLDQDQEAWFTESTTTLNTIDIETNDSSLAATNTTIHFNLTFTDYNDPTADMCILLDEDEDNPTNTVCDNGVVSNSYEIVVNFLPCVVDETDFVLP